MDNFEGKLIQESSLKTVSSITKAIHCESISKHSSTRSRYKNHESKLKFIPPGSLRRAVQKAKSDLDLVFRNSLHGSVLSSQNPLNMYHEKPLATTSNTPRPRNKTEYLSTKELKYDEQSSCYSQTPIPSSGKKIKVKKLNPKENQHQTPSTSSKQPFLSSEDLRWLGKNYVHHNGNASYKKTETLHQNEDRTIPSPHLIKRLPAEKCSDEIHFTAVELINRVQLREQQLWKQLAEMSLSSYSPSVTSDFYEGNCDPLLTTSLPVKTNPDLSFTMQQQPICDVARLTSVSGCSFDPDYVLSLLDDEWFDNLLKVELGIKKD